MTVAESDSGEQVFTHLPTFAIKALSPLGEPMSANRPRRPMSFVVPALSALTLLTGFASLQTAAPIRVSGAALSGHVFGG